MLNVEDSAWENYIPTAKSQMNHNFPGKAVNLLRLN